MPRLVIGTFQNRDFRILKEIINASIRTGFTGFDTAPSYDTEVQLGRAIQICATENGLSRDDFFISDKIDAWQMQAKNGYIRQYVEIALKKLRTNYLDMLLIHWPIEQYMDNTWEAMQMIQREGLVRNIGLCNVRTRHLKDFAQRNIIPKFIQIERHPLRTCDDEMEYCKQNEIKVLSYSPLCRMHPHLLKNRMIKKIAAKYNKNIGQIILRWQIDTNATPVFMTKNLGRIVSNTDIFDFSLNELEVKSISALNENYKIFLESWGCPGF